MLLNYLIYPFPEDLQSTAGHFRRGANQVRKRMWWKDLKWKIIIAVTIIVILGIIIGKNSTSTTSKKELTTVFFISSLRGIPHRLGSIVGTQVRNNTEEWIPQILISPFNFW